MKLNNLKELTDLLERIGFEYFINDVKLSEETNFDTEKKEETIFFEIVFPKAKGMLMIYVGKGQNE